MYQNVYVGRDLAGDSTPEIPQLNREKGKKRDKEREGREG